jgi:4-diphosphocytidyl-2-C-methyl-D-erythritol kinase
LNPAVWAGYAEPFVNDLESPVAAHHPEIARIIGRLRADGALHAAMTGSGSAVFGLFSDRMRAARIADALDSRSRRSQTGRLTLVTRTLNRSTYQRLAAT